MRTGPIYWKARRILRGFGWANRVTVPAGSSNFASMQARLTLATWMINRGRIHRDHIILIASPRQAKTIKAIIVQHKLGMITERSARL